MRLIDKLLCAIQWNLNPIGNVFSSIIRVKQEKKKLGKSTADNQF